MLADHNARLTEADGDNLGIASAYQHGDLVVSRNAPVTPAAASAPPSGHGRWATSADWAAHKDRVVRMYWNEDRTLKEVMSIMATEYDFHATVKMYKSRFKLWGLAKNIIKEDASRIIQAAWSGERPDEPVVKGRKVGSKRFRKQLQTARELGARFSSKESSLQTPSPPTMPPGSPDQLQKQQQVMMSSSACSSPTSLSHRLWQPDVLGQSERACHAIHSYTDFCLNTKVWELASVTADDALNLPKGRTFKVFVVDNYMSMTAGFQDPTFITATMSVVLQLEEFAKELATSLLRYIYHMSVVKLGAHHPFSCFWAHMTSLGVVNARHAVESTLRVHYDTLQRQMHPEDIKYWGDSPGSGRRLARYTDFARDQMPSNNFMNIMYDMEADVTSVVDEIYINWCQIMLSYFIAHAAPDERGDPNRFVAKDADAEVDRIKVEDVEDEEGSMETLHKLEHFEDS
ncbi:hypothetical protein PFICI_09351 [Pestalotiopsis fici W106-1]|uniref:Clr5 domain-containing protein n=1 Tax=Pestalotiopsis fici (strain W106-1 / CGMCC3.15140) TaxID=1229662 RepID=W3X033_PESFW|nr:uncharacterized protein PFICI_09351 [Pestalotiopsis fici W106-1]ETS79498.1 hypothetical protein PFICI_09351 [Pestalotiopsis fici W106-1]